MGFYANLFFRYSQKKMTTIEMQMTTICQILKKILSTKVKPMLIAHDLPTANQKKSMPVEVSYYNFIFSIFFGDMNCEIFNILVLYHYFHQSSSIIMTFWKAKPCHITVSNLSAKLLHQLSKMSVRDVSSNVWQHNVGFQTFLSNQHHKHWKRPIMY